ncbi:MAG: FAD-dependent oxidoreductase [Coriobacteriales bacterium]|jgi:NADPH-dependent glutamate synthase beta subunit-like oxidoreductase|nr:FAD-dependent oxidoreductase [Coriobacteriales bacterium]
MTRIQVYEKSYGQERMEDAYAQLAGGLDVGALTSCPVELAAAAVKLMGAQSCGKCTPCRVGLAQLEALVEQVLDGTATREVLDLIAELAEVVATSSDCAVGYEAGAFVLTALKGFYDDFVSHIENGDCTADAFAPVPCVEGCPAHVDIPGYMALVQAGRYRDAIGLVRKDNPFAVACGLICEHPCELYCRRGMVDDVLNIRGIKRFAADHSDGDYQPPAAEPTGKRVAVVGSGPAGLTCAYYLALMGHSPVVFEQRERLGGMLRYGIPSYRLPREALDAEIAWLTSQGIETRLGTAVGTDVRLAELREEFDAVYLAFGAHSDNRLGIAGEDAAGVLSAVELLRAIGDEQLPDLSGKRVVVVGGGNVAMDCARSALRLGAESVTVAYRRRKLDMTAQTAEIEAAVAEGCKLLELHAPVSIDVSGQEVAGLVLQPQAIGEIAGGRAKPHAADAAPLTLACDLVVVAIGQRIDASSFESEGVELQRGMIVSTPKAEVPGMEGVYAGGDCVSGPLTVIRAVAAGKAAAASIDSYLGFDHRVSFDIEVPTAMFKGRAYCARSNMTEPAIETINGNFALVEAGLRPEEAAQESARCLRCDHFGRGAFRGGRSLQW